MRDPALTARSISEFRDTGLLVVAGLAPRARVGELRELAQADLAGNPHPAEFEADLRYPGAPASREAPGGTTTRRLLQAVNRHPAFRDWASCPEVVTPLRQLMAPEVMLSQTHHNCVMTKQPRFSSVTGWHQDIRYWSFPRPELISVWLALGREIPENGCLSFLPGTYAMDVAREQLDDGMFLREDLVENQRLISNRVTPVLEPGDVVFFHCRTFHAAGNNRTDKVKLSLVFTYHAADNPPLSGTRSASLPPVAV